MDPTINSPNARRRWLPRTRGDGPRDPVTALYHRMASPHTRGWTLVSCLHHERCEGFPAHAGMDPRRLSHRRLRPWLPRTRGDGPEAVRSSWNGHRASPHTRGWTEPSLALGQLHPGFPAHAGMDLGHLGRPYQAQRLPRTRGDGPTPEMVAAYEAKASPHTRGWTLGLELIGQAPGGFPAHAGMDPIRRCQGSPGQRLPRTRGDGPRVDKIGHLSPRASPHTRGWTLEYLTLAVESWGFPAHAGMDPTCSTGPIGRRRLPRTRGDGPEVHHVRPIEDGASPHTRGWTRRGHHRRFASLGFPAHAGMDPREESQEGTSDGLPRTRGDGPMYRDGIRRIDRASPHTRGWTAGQRLSGDHDGGFPAHAGMDPP